MTTDKNIEDFVVICDKTNNSEDSIKQGYLYVDIYIPRIYYKLEFIVNKDGTIQFEPSPNSNDISYERK